MSGGSAGRADGLATHHATALVIGRSGLLLEGPPGAGKSALALMLIRHAAASGLFAALVADDRVVLEECSGRLCAACPPAIAGLMEVRGAGPVAVAHAARAVMDAIVELAAPDDMERVPPPGRFAERLGVALPVIRCPRHRPDEGAAIVLASGLAGAARIAGFRL
jgi:HPr kinase/phosphorylase